MKTQSQIEQAISQLFFSLQSVITSYAKGSSVRAKVVSVSASLADLWNETTQLKRKLFWSTAQDTDTANDLDVLGSEIGLSKYGAISLSTIVVFSSGQIQNGTSTSAGLNFLADTSKTWTVNKYTGWILYDSAGNQFTVISNTANILTISGTPAAGAYYVFPIVPAGTSILSKISGLSYLTVNPVIVGLSNPVLLGKTNSVPLGNRTIATCSIAGSQGQVQANELTVFAVATPGVDSVTNPIPSQPRTSADIESDDAFRARATTFISTLDIGTQAFFESLAVRGNSSVLRAIAIKNPAADGIIIYIATRSGESLSNTDLTNLAAYVYARSKAFDTIICQNMVMTDIFISYQCALPAGIVPADYYTQVAEAIANYLDYSSWDIDDTITDDNLFVQVNAVNKNVDIDLDSFIVQASLNSVPYESKTINLVNSLPRFARLQITDTISSTVIDYVLSSYPISQQNDPLLNPNTFL